MSFVVHEVLRPSDLDDEILTALGDQEYGELVGYSEETIDSGTFTTVETQIGAVTFNQINGYTYIVVCIVQLVSTGTDVYQATLREDTSGGAEVHSRRTDSRTSDQARPNNMKVRRRYVAGSTSSKTFVVTGVRISGLGTVHMEAGTAYPQPFMVFLVDKP